MVKKDLLIIADYSEESVLSLEELCAICDIPPNDIQELITYEIVLPAGDSSAEWVFDIVQLQRLQTALRLRRDLEVNLAGVALVLDLLDELQEKRTRLEILERHLLRGE